MLIIENIFRVALWCKIEAKHTWFTWRGKWEKFRDVLAEKKVIFSWLMNWNMVTPEKFDHLHLVYHFTVPLRHQTYAVDRYKQGQSFWGIFWTVWRTVATFQVHFNLATDSNYSITNYIKSPVFIFFEKANKRRLKMVNVKY